MLVTWMAITTTSRWNNWYHANEGSSFPVPSSLIEKACTFNDYDVGKVFELGENFVVRTGKLNHPNGACGYRLECGGKVIAICTDTEHFEDRLDENVLELAKDADIMVYDAAYTDEEYPNFKGWGHSTWQEAVKIAKAANVKQTFLFHHDPSHNDKKMDEIASAVSSIHSGIRPAIEGEERFSSKFYLTFQTAGKEI